MATAAWLEEHPKVLAYLSKDLYAQVRDFCTDSSLSLSKAVESLIKKGLGLSTHEPPQPQAGETASQIQALEQRIAVLEKFLKGAGGAVENAPCRSPQDSSFQPESDRNPEPPFEPPASYLVGNVGEVTLAVDDRLDQGQEEQSWELPFEEDEIKDLEMLPSSLNITLDRTDAAPSNLSLQTSSLCLPAARSEQSSLGSTDIETNEALSELRQNLHKSEQKQDNQGTIKNPKEVPRAAETRPLKKPKKGIPLFKKMFGE